MIIVYNIAGALVAFGGVVAGIILFAVTGSLAAGMLAIAAIWIWFGRSKPDRETGVRGPSPAVFFIPMYVWGIVAGVAVVPALLADAAGKHRAAQIAADPRSAEFERDEKAIDTNQSDDENLAAAVREVLSRVAPGYVASLRLRVEGDSVLVLLKLPDLKKMKEPTRVVLLEEIRKAITEQRPEAKVYAGIKGKFSFGGILTPTTSPNVGSIVDDQPLLGFYSKPAAAAATSPDPAAIDKPESAEASAN